MKKLSIDLELEKLSEEWKQALALRKVMFTLSKVNVIVSQETGKSISDKIRLLDDKQKKNWEEAFKELLASIHRQEIDVNQDSLVPILKVLVRYSVLTY